MASANNQNNAVVPTAPPAEEVISPGTIANFEAIFQIRVFYWKEKQRLLTIGRIATPDEKANLIRTKKAELKKLLRLCNVSSTQKVLLLIIWDTRETDLIVKKLDNTILCNLEKNKSSNLSKRF